MQAYQIALLISNQQTCPSLILFVGFTVKVNINLFSALSCFGGKRPKVKLTEPSHTVLPAMRTTNLLFSRSAMHSSAPARKSAFSFGHITCVS